MLREHRMNEVNRLHASATGERQRIGELMNKKDEWITRAVHVLRKVEFGGTELDYGDSDDAWGDPWEDSCCPCCRVVDGHTDDCELHRLLEEAKDIDGNQ